jgi:cation diffusion facilitator CzcD-associated flavoprotein CzcO
VNDGWTHTPAGAGILGSTKRTVEPQHAEQHVKDLFKLDRQRTDVLRKRIDDVVKDKDTAEKLKPWYGSWCKRPTFHDDYLEAFNQPNVVLIDTDGKGLDAFYENGFVSGGQEYEIDAFILATGFLISGNIDPSEKLDAVIKGHNGETISHKYETTENPPVFGLAMSNFPNLFGHLDRGVPASWNLTSVYDLMATNLAQTVKKAHVLAKHGERVIIQADPDGEEKWGNQAATTAAWYAAVQACTPSYFNGEGEHLKAADDEQSMKKKLRDAKLRGWGAGPVDYQQKLEASAAKPDLEGYIVTVLA